MTCWRCGAELVDDRQLVPTCDACAGKVQTRVSRRARQASAAACAGKAPRADLDQRYPRVRHREPWGHTDIRRPGEAPPPPQTVRRMFVYGLPENLKFTLIRGTGIADWLRAQRVPVTNSRIMRGWTVRTEHVGDLIAHAEHDGVVVKMMGQLR